MGKLRFADRTRTRLRTCWAAPFVTARLARSRSVLTLLPSLTLSRVLRVLRCSTHHREGSHLRQVHDLSLPSFFHADLPRRTSWNQTTIDLGEAFLGRLFLCHPALFLVDGRRARESAGRMRRRQRVDHEDRHRAVLPPDLKPLWPLRGLEHRPALRARREPDPCSHPHVRPRRRLRRGAVLAMLEIRRSQSCAPASSRSGPCSRPTSARAATHRSWSAATSRTYIATATCVVGPYALLGADCTPQP
jgi:hypothetical protein